MEAVLKLFDSLSVSMGKLGNRVSDAARALQALSSTIDYPSDFRAFISKADFKFVDVSPPPFERFKFSSRYSAPDVYVIERFAMPYLPLRMALAKADFVGASSDEISLKKGEILYLMQAPGEDWVFATTRVYGTYGWVPTSFIEVIGVGIAVVVDKAGAPTFQGKSRSFVAVAGPGEDGEVNCIDAKGNPLSVARSALAIL
jgi:hypothetical protein